MAEPQKYISELTGEQLDAAFRQMAVIDQSVSQAASSAAQAAGSASQSAQAADRAAESASAAGQSAGDAESSAAAAASSAAGASGSEDAAAESARQAAASAASIAGDVEQAAASANAASQSATQAESSASAAAASASAAADSEDEVQANAAAAQQAAASASASEKNAKASETAAASSAQTATGAASAAQTSETNAAESARQAAASVASIGDDVATSAANAQAAQQAASDASASAAAAEDAATRAEQIADFDPSDFATAAQGTKADTAVQSVNDKTGTAITLAAADVGAATAAQGSLAETAVQPDALDAYALKTDVPDTPADIGAATAAQGAKADTAVQSVNGAKPDAGGNVQLDLTTGTVRSVNGKDPDGSGNVQLSAGDVGAATAAQGALAATAVQPADLNEYAKAGDIPTELPNPQALGIRLGSGGSVTAYDGSVARTVTITPEAIGAMEPLIGTTDTLTPQQVRDALLAGRLCVVTNATGGNDHTVAEWAVISSCVQGLSGWALNDLGSGQQLHLSELCGYFDERGWVFRDIYAPVLPEITAADNGKTVSAQNGVWALADAASGGGRMDLLWTNSSKSFQSNQSITLNNLQDYDMVGIMVYGNTGNQASENDLSGINVFPIPASGSLDCVLQSSTIDSGTGFAEVESRRIQINRNSITSTSYGALLNLYGGSPSDDICVPYRIYGIKF